MPRKLLTLAEVANLLSVQFYRIKYAHQAGMVPEPMRIGNRRLYTEADLKRLERHFNKEERAAAVCLRR